MLHNRITAAQVSVGRDERAVGHHLPDDAELQRLENENLFSLRDLAESGRVPIESVS